MAAEIGFGSTDGERFSKGVALVGDGYYCRFTDFKYFTNHMSRCRKCHQLDNCNDDLFCQSCIKEMDEKMNNWRKK